MIETAPGEGGQVDGGDGPMVRDPETGKYRRMRMFVFMLGCSRKSVRLLTFRSSSQIWAELHERAFRLQFVSTETKGNQNEVVELSGSTCLEEGDALLRR